MYTIDPNYALMFFTQDQVLRAANARAARPGTRRHPGRVAETSPLAWRSVVPRPKRWRPRPATA